MDEMNNSKGEKGYAGIRREAGVDELGREKTDKALGAAQSNQPTVHPTLHAKIGDEKVRVKIDTGGSSSYICSDFVTELKLTPVRQEMRCIE
ncbi:Hypothetical predicted protein [Paramuricea clavata]|uniref:Uncharacterized protein n=1 Tax=Paramuricea clavata TaxID=317549 RepID=A0A6S7GPK4_PARCT|nr:Hypothetical predicted protein [Paramuricea clavata]